MITATHAVVVQAAEAAEKTQDKGLLTQAREFEAIFVRELLKGARIGGEGAGEFGSMVVDSLAGVIADAGGVGLANRIEDMLSKNRSK